MARAARLVLALLASTGAVAGYLAGGARSWGTIVGAGLGAVLVAIAIAVGLTYAVAGTQARSVPAAHRARVGSRLLAVLREFLAHVAVFTALMPFERLWVRDRVQRGAGSGTAPVLLVHGYLLNGAAWWRFARLVEREGFRAHTVTVGPPLGSIDAMVASLARRIEEICAAAGTPQVHLVAHSMGGLVCRAYLRAHGAGRVARLVTIGSPHHGTAVARLGIGRCAREMTPGSPWLAALAESERGAPHPLTVALFSYYDNYITPPESSMLPWARNEALPALGHVEMYFSRRVAARVCAALRATGA